MKTLENIYVTLVRGYKKETFLFFLAALVLALVQAPLPYLSGYLIDSVLPNERYDLLLVSTGLMALLYVLFLVVSFITDKFRLKVRKKLTVALSEKALQGIFSMPRTRRLKLHGGDLTSRLTRDVSELHYIMPYGWAELAHKLMLCVIILTIVFYLNWKLSTILLLLIPAAVIVFLRFEKSLWVESSLESESSAEKLAAIQDTVEADAEVRSYQAEEFFLSFSGGRIGNYEQRRYRRELLDTKIGILAIGMPMLAVVLVWYLGGRMVMNGEITLGFIITYTTSLTLVVPALIFVIDFASGVPNEIVALNRLRELIEDQEQRTLMAPSGRSEEVQPVARLHAEALAFHYQESRPLLSGLDITFERGRIHLINGANGTGKSTLLQLLAGVLQPESGSIQLDEYVVDKIDNRSDWITYVPQQIRLFSGSVRDNLTLGDDYLDVELMEKIDQMGLMNWLCSLEHGLDHRLENPNRELSGGQIQKLGLARAFLRESPVLLLDEPTNNLDSLAVEEILACFEKRKREQITVVVSHDKRFTDIVDQVVYLENTVGRKGTRVDVRADIRLER